MRTTLELPDPLFARLKARAAMKQVSLKQLFMPMWSRGLMHLIPLPLRPAVLPVTCRHFRRRCNTRTSPSAMRVCLSFWSLERYR